MEIILAKEAGFCFGVKRAVNIALESAKDGRVLTFGPLIHNPDFLKYLSEKNIDEISNIDDIKDCNTLVIRAHGIPRELELEIKEKADVKIADATCVFVKKVQLLADKLCKEGYEIILLGDDHHPEVAGIKSYAIGHIHVIANEADVPDLEQNSKIAFMSQTTQNEKLFARIKIFLEEKFPNVLVCNTICDATDKRQSEAVDIAKRVDVMIVVGGKDSSNTNRLREICEPYVKTFQVENASELDKKWFVEAKTVGVTAGASTPDFSIESVIESIGNFVAKK